jgi:hypothetical protein
MLITHLLTESQPRTLYHGTLKEFVPDIMDFGLLPQVGKFTAHAYDEYRQAGIPLANVVFAASRQDLYKCVSAIIGQMRHQYPQWDMHSGDQDITAQDFYKHAALLVLKHAESRWQQRPRDDIAGDYPAQVEPADYFIRGADLPDFVLTDKRLQNFFRRNNIQLSKYGIQDVNQGRAELVRRGLTPRPTR